jgi:hypothetical protein
MGGEKRQARQVIGVGKVWHGGVGRDEQRRPRYGGAQHGMAGQRAQLQAADRACTPMMLSPRLRPKPLRIATRAGSGGFMAPGSVGSPNGWDAAGFGPSPPCHRDLGRASPLPRLTASSRTMWGQHWTTVAQISECETAEAVPACSGMVVAIADAVDTG